MFQSKWEPAFGGSRGGGRPPAGESTVRLAASSMIPTGRQEVERGRGSEAGQEHPSTKGDWGKEEQGSCVTSGFSMASHKQL